MTNPTTVILADDHALVRETLANWLNGQPDISVVGVCANSEEAVTVASRQQPEVAILDIDMPGQSPFEAAKLIRAQSPATRFIFLSAFFNDQFIQQALDVGAAGYLTKGETSEAVAQGIRDVRMGKVCFSPEVLSRLVIDPSGVKLANEPCTRMATLTSREQELLRFMARAMSRNDIAEAMHISVHTVDRHTANLMQKLSIHSRAGLCRYAIREGLAGV
jgi:DNA-binding NarL/FixJ family response regulator